MKKIICLLLTSFLTLFIFAKENNEKRKEEFVKNGGEGFDYFIWGSSVDEFLTQYPQAINITDDKYMYSKYQIFGLQIDNQQSQYYLFYDNSLYYGVTIFSKITNIDKINAISERLQELYGPISSKDEFSQTKNVTVMGTPISYKEEGWWAEWEKSSTFLIKEELTSRYGVDNYYGSAQENTQSMLLFVNASVCDLVITYSNPVIEKEVNKYLEDFDKIKEAEKKQKEKEQLNF